VMKLVWSLIAISAVGTAAPNPVRQQEIRDAALKSLSLLDGVNRTWLKQGYCYSCHNDGLFNKLHSVGAPARSACR
jgi:hypothetical protein